MLVAFLSSAILAAYTPSQQEQALLDVRFHGLQEQAEVFPLLELNPDGAATDFQFDLAEHVVTLDNGEVMGGFRFIAPANAKGADFVWYFNAPQGWANWYLFPANGPFKPSFRTWFDADKVYEGFDNPTAPDRMRVLQELGAGYFKSRKEYIMWFRQVREGGDSNVRGRLMFAGHEKEWSLAALEEALDLKPLSVADQVRALDSRGGRILLDTDFFDPQYARDQIDSYFVNWRHARKLKGGFFITMETSCPPSTTEPSLKEIESRYGPPDFVQTSAEAARVYNHGNAQEPEDEDNLTVYYYDYFGFEVPNDDPEQRVSSVVSTSHDFAILKPTQDASFERLPMKNLTVLHRDGHEVGRLYFFLEGPKEPLCVLEPPVGEYRKDDQGLEYLGDGEWLQKNYYEDGSLARSLHYAQHRMNGRGEGYYRDGSLTFTANYKDGQLDGEVVEYTPEGEVKRRRTFRDGRLLSEE